jgi:hypothetical protein
LRFEIVGLACGFDNWCFTLLKTYYLFSNTLLTFLGGKKDQKLGCAAYLHANIDDIAVFHYMMICLLS